MADNYLEKKMEEYRAGKLGHSSHKRKTYLPTAHRSELKDARVYVTGGAKGIGRSIVKSFIDEGCKVTFCDIDSKAGAATAQATGSQFHPLDVTDTDALERSLKMAIEQRGGIDIIINNVGTADFKSLPETSLTDFERTLNINMRPVYVTAKVYCDYLSQIKEEHHYGRIINICSTRHLMSEPDTLAYSASKGAIAAMTHSLMMSLAMPGVTVNSISPGWIHTGSPNDLTEADHRMHPSGRVGRPEDIARACVFLAAPSAEFINGIDLIIDGGMTHKMVY